MVMMRRICQPWRDEPWTAQIPDALMTVAGDERLRLSSPATCMRHCAERMSDIPVVAIDNNPGATFGKLYVVDYSWTGTFMRVQVSSSTDGGTTWSKPRRVAPRSDTHDQFLPWLNVA